MMSETPPHPRPRQEREARVAPSVSSSAKRTTSLTSPHHPQETTCATGGAHVGAPRSGVQRLRLWCRARSVRPRPGCRIGAQAPGAARHLGAERVARGGDGSQRLRRLAHRRAERPRRAAPCAERRARSARRRSGSPQAPGAQSAHATGAERVARGGAPPAGILAQLVRASSRSSNAGKLLPASATLTSFVYRWDQNYVTSTWPSAPYLSISTV